MNPNLVQIVVKNCYIKLECLRQPTWVEFLMFGITQILDKNKNALAFYSCDVQMFVFALKLAKAVKEFQDTPTK